MNLAIKLQQVSLFNRKFQNNKIEKLYKDESNIYDIGLGLIKGIGGKTYKKLIESYGSSKEVFFAKPIELCRISGVSFNLAKEITSSNILGQAHKLVEYSNKAGVKIITYLDKTYPEKLRNTCNPPAILYMRGSLNFNRSRMISIVGTRQASEYGLRALKSIINKLKVYNIVVVSGLARGIDFYAHKEALENNLKTVSILPCSIAEIYPIHHTHLSNDIIKNGCLISEYPHYVYKERYYFPARNRIIAGISDATIVIEAGKKSGALITAEYANEYNREVFALPGDIGKSKSEGCNKLISSHKAHIISSAEDIITLMNWDIVHNSSCNKYALIKPILDSLSGVEKIVVNSLDTLGVKGINMHNLASIVKIQIMELFSIVANLEMKNLIVRLPGDKVALKCI